MAEQTESQQTQEAQDNSQLIRYLVLFVIILTGILIIVALKPFGLEKPTRTDLTLTNKQNSNQPTTNQADTNQPQSPKQRKQPNMQQPKQLPQPDMIIDTSKEYQALIQTNRGDIKVELYASDTPKTVNNFVYLAQNNFYQGTIFHRVIKDFMIQGGDPTGTGMGGPGYKFEDEDSSNKLVKGSLAMANSGPDTNGSQFFIVTTESTPWLDGKHTNFGQVIEGMDVVEKIAQVKTGAQDKPIEPVVIEGVEIIKK